VKAVSDEEFNVNRVDVGLLLLDFLDMYGNKFNFHTAGMKIANGGSYFPKADWMPLSLHPRQYTGTPCLVDPENAENDVGRACSRIEDIREGFRRALSALRRDFVQRKQGSRLVGILPPCWETASKRRALLTRYGGAPAVVMELAQLYAHQPPELSEQDLDAVKEALGNRTVITTRREATQAAAQQQRVGAPGSSGRSKKRKKPERTKLVKQKARELVAARKHEKQRQKRLKLEAANRADPQARPTKKSKKLRRKIAKQQSVRTPPTPKRKATAASSSSSSSTGKRKKVGNRAGKGEKKKGKIARTKSTPSKKAGSGADRPKKKRTRASM
jgi:DNA polymerase sigma